MEFQLSLTDDCALCRSDLSIAPRRLMIPFRHSVGVTYMLDARAMAVGEQVTPTEFRPLPLPSRYREDTPTECCNPTHYPWVGFSPFSHSLSPGIQTLRLW